MYTCAVTGHRPGKLLLGPENSVASCWLRKKLHLQLLELYDKGVRRFLLGGALGVDLWTAELLVFMQKGTYFTDVKIVLVLPFKGYDQRWKEQDRERMKVIRDHSIQTILVGDGQDPNLCYRLRNQYLVDHADCLLAVYNPVFSRSGTGMTLRYGEKKGIPIFHLSPRGRN